MEALFYLIGLSNYLNPEIEQARHNLTNDLKDKFHARRVERSVETISCKVDRKVNADKLKLAVDYAKSKNASPYELASLASHENFEVRLAVADNPNAPLSTLVKLSQDEHDDVRFRIAESYHVSPVILKKLQEDENPYVSCRAETTLARLANERLTA